MTDKQKEMFADIVRQNNFAFIDRFRFVFRNSEVVLVLYQKLFSFYPILSLLNASCLVYNNTARIQYGDNRYTNALVLSKCSGTFTI